MTGVHRSCQNHLLVAWAQPVPDKAICLAVDSSRVVQQQLRHACPCQLPHLKVLSIYGLA